MDEHACLYALLHRIVFNQCVAHAHSYNIFGDRRQCYEDDEYYAFLDCITELQYRQRDMPDLKMVSVSFGGGTWHQYDAFDCSMQQQVHCSVSC